MSYNKYKNYNAGTTTNSSTQTTTTAGIVVNGLTFSYIPVKNSSEVIFEYSFYAEKNNGIPFIHTEIEYSTDNGSSFTNIGEKYKMYSCSGPYNNFYIHYRVLCKLSSWSGERIIRVKAFEHNYSSATNVAILHYISDLNEYINTNYIIYSE